MRTWKATVGLMLAAALTATGVNAQTADNVANTSQKGSLLIWPEVGVSGRDTLIRLQNDNVAAVDVKCYWLNGTKFRRDFAFKLTKKQPYWFYASDGDGTDGVPPFPTDVESHGVPGDRYSGTLICWATDTSGANQINFNHLAGSATVFEGEGGGVHEYNAWAFKARGAAAGQIVGTGGNIQLNGLQYDACPQYLISTFIPRNESGTIPAGATDLVVTSCNQDLRQDFVNHFTKLEFTVFNEHEVKATGAYQCIDSWYETALDNVQQSPGNFSALSVKTPLGRYKVQGVASTQCTGSETAGLVGVQTTHFSSDSAGVNLNAAGTTAGYVLWDVSDPNGVPEKR
jgi:hypothetical protein